MGIPERRAREREQRRREILLAAWEVAESRGWAAFSVEQVAQQAELGRATVYGYFDSLQALLVAMAEEALEMLSQRLAATTELRETLDVPVRFAQANPSAFQLLFAAPGEVRQDFSSPELERVRAEARRSIDRLARLLRNNGATLPEDAQGAAAFVRGITLAAAVVPELKASTTLRWRWQQFCLGTPGGAPSNPEKDD